MVIVSSRQSIRRPRTPQRPSPLPHALDRRRARAKPRQIKPVSFFIGSQYDLIKDRKKVFTQFERLLKGKNEYNVNKLFFAIYKTDNNGKMEFFNEKDTYFHHFRDYDDMVNRDWKKICDNSKIWTEIKHEISRQ